MGSPPSQTLTFSISTLLRPPGDRENLKELRGFICAAAEQILEREGYDNVHDYESDTGLSLGGSIAIFQLVDHIEGVEVNQFIRHTVVEQKVKESSERYALYLSLKQEFESGDTVPA